MPRLDSTLTVAVFCILFAVELGLLRLFGDRAQASLLDYAAAGTMRKLLLYPLLAPGVAVHELAHALACVALGAPVGKIVPFRPQTLPDGSRVLGYVQHGRARLPLLQPLIAYAPLVLPTLGVYALAPLLVPSARFALDPRTLGHALAAHPFALGTIVWAALALSISLSAFPSDSDLRGNGLAGLLLGALCLIPIVLSLAHPSDGPHLLVPYLWLALLLLPSLLATALCAGLLGLHRR
jgi:hypothetical protein